MTGPDLADSVPAHARIADGDTTSVAEGCSTALLEALRLRFQVIRLVRRILHSRPWWKDFAFAMFNTITTDLEIGTS